MVALARPHQWLKNGLVLAALLFGQRLFVLGDCIRALTALAAFCALSSAAYSLNDIIDRDTDRVNPEKGGRPLACGDLSVGAATVMSVALTAAAFGLGYGLGWGFVGVAALYVGLQLAYSLGAKRILFVDVILVAVGFVLRAVAGGVAIDVEVSPWLVFITFVLAMLLVLGRRRHELVSLGGDAATHRNVLAGYNIRLVDQMLSIVGGATLVSYMIYTASAEIESKLGTRYLYLTVPLVAFGMLRYLYLIEERNAGGDPAWLMVTDRPMLVTVLLWIVADIALLYL